MMYHKRCMKSIDRAPPDGRINVNSTERRNLVPSEVRCLWYGHVTYDLLFIIMVYASLIDIMARGISPK